MQIIWINTCASTQDELSKHPSYISGVYTLDQKKGRGRLGRSWLSAPQKTLALSWRVSIQQIPLEKIPLLSLASGVALYEWLEERFFTKLTQEKKDQLNHKLCLKWPNDLLFQGKKLAGILCEGRLGSANPEVLIGIGINLLPDPSLPDQSCSLVDLLDELGLFEAKASLLDSERHSFIDKELRYLCKKLEDLPVVLQEQVYLDNMLDHWRARALPIGTVLSTQQHQGTFQGITAQGALLLDNGERVVTVESGEVNLLSALV